jgi:hypothetical protein
LCERIPLWSKCTTGEEEANDVGSPHREREECGENRGNKIKQEDILTL